MLTTLRQTLGARTNFGKAILSLATLAVPCAIPTLAQASEVTLNIRSAALVTPAPVWVVLSLLAIGIFLISLPLFKHRS
ncbi:MAG: hypothetical protein EON60_12910 [Alphaproteobacteria bacterium]|nr:MAG: hypothetical protein EON60_12910 [Alphaproteobacteria bacterium]